MSKALDIKPISEIRYRRIIDQLQQRPSQNLFNGLHGILNLDTQDANFMGKYSDIVSQHPEVGDLFSPRGAIGHSMLSKQQQIDRIKTIILQITSSCILIKRSNGLFKKDTIVKSPSIVWIMLKYLTPNQLNYRPEFHAPIKQIVGKIYSKQNEKDPERRVDLAINLLEIRLLDQIIYAYNLILPTRKCSNAIFMLWRMFTKYVGLTSIYRDRQTYGSNLALAIEQLSNDEKTKLCQLLSLPDNVWELGASAKIDCIVMKIHEFAEKRRREVLPHLSVPVRQSQDSLQRRIYRSPRDIYMQFIVAYSRYKSELINALHDKETCTVSTKTFFTSIPDDEEDRMPLLHQFLDLPNTFTVHDQYSYIAPYVIYAMRKRFLTRVDRAGEDNSGRIQYNKFILLKLYEANLISQEFYGLLNLWVKSRNLMAFTLIPPKQDKSKIKVELGENQDVFIDRMAKKYRLGFGYRSDNYKLTADQIKQMKHLIHQDSIGGRKLERGLLLLWALYRGYKVRGSVDVDTYFHYIKVEGRIVAYRNTDLGVIIKTPDSWELVKQSSSYEGAFKYLTKRTKNMVLLRQKCNQLMEDIPIIPLQTLKKLTSFKSLFIQYMITPGVWLSLNAGTSLDDLVKDGHIFNIVSFEQCIKDLDDMHSIGITHGDLSLKNVFISNDIIGMSDLDMLTDQSWDKVKYVKRFKQFGGTPGFIPHGFKSYMTYLKCLHNSNQWYYEYLNQRRQALDKIAMLKVLFASLPKVKKNTLYTQVTDSDRARQNCLISTFLCELESVILEYIKPEYQQVVAQFFIVDILGLDLNDAHKGIIKKLCAMDDTIFTVGGYGKPGDLFKVLDNLKLHEIIKFA